MVRGVKHGTGMVQTKRCIVFVSAIAGIILHVVDYWFVYDLVYDLCFWYIFILDSSFFFFQWVCKQNM